MVNTHLTGYTLYHGPEWRTAREWIGTSFSSWFASSSNTTVCPKAGALGIRETFGDGRPCDACDEPIDRKQKAALVMVPLEWMSVRLHADCYKVWDVERLALAEKNGVELMTDLFRQFLNGLPARGGYWPPTASAKSMASQPRRSPDT